jgi:thiol:disulfide interchange protein
MVVTQGWKIDYITVDVPKTNLEEAKLLFEHKGYTLANEDEDAYHFVKQFKAGETKGFCSHPETKRNRKILKRRSQKAKRRLRKKKIKENGVDSGSVKPKQKTKSCSSSQEKTKGNAIAT